MDEPAEKEPGGQESQTLQTEAVELVEGLGQQHRHDQAGCFHRSIVPQFGPMEESKEYTSSPLCICFVIGVARSLAAKPFESVIE